MIPHMYIAELLRNLHNARKWCCVCADHRPAMYRSQPQRTNKLDRASPSHLSEPTYSAINCMQHGCMWLTSSRPTHVLQASGLSCITSDHCTNGKRRDYPTSRPIVILLGHYLLLLSSTLPPHLPKDLSIIYHKSLSPLPVLSRHALPDEEALLRAGISCLPPTHRR